MRVVLIVLVIALTLYAVLDCARTPSESLPQPLPKPIWLLVIILFSVVGPVAWIITSRVKAAEDRGGMVERSVWSSQEGISFQRRGRQPQRRALGPDDDPEFLRNLEQDIRRRKYHPKEDDGQQDRGPTGPQGPTGQ
ncbi:PLD nuclease N-terminal domain-containing protein [Actinomyces trachealis]|uniref:PLD nuclease N-terminal domain-containing protein n=1 Tax=Actinomyces trachealis TaxID=2763540 RepID=UPI0018929FAD|nr:PLD nuclease N-terminal domain-containing protein [Actinomyces trachealis]